MKFKLLSLFVLAVILSAGTVDLDNLFDYAGQEVPEYIDKDNTPPGNEVTNEGATLGRVLFYDKRLSVNNTIACASCHKQEFAFSDTATLSVGLNGGVTGRHAMRLVNSRFGIEERFFWDERATSLEDQTTQPIQDHVEMGYSGQEGSPDFNDLIDKLSEIEEYRRLFELVYGDSEVTEDRVQRAIAQFVRSIQSFDSKFDEGYAIVGGLGGPYPNFTPEENQGKALFVRTPAQGGAGCQGCHVAPEFDIDPLSQNNGIISVAGDPDEVDLTNTRSPSLRDLVNANGVLNGPMMHAGDFTTIRQVIDHYNNIRYDQDVNPGLDARLRGIPPSLTGQQLNLSEDEKQALEAFLLTLTGSDIYTNEMYSDPFAPDGTLELLPILTSIETAQMTKINIYPNPVKDFIQIKGIERGEYQINIHDLSGRLVFGQIITTNQPIDLHRLDAGVHILSVTEPDGIQITSQRIVKVD